MILLFPTKVLHKARMPKKGNKCIVTSNHYSNWDCIVYDIHFARKFRYVAKKELFKNKFVGFILKDIGGIPIDRDQITPSSFKVTMRELKKNHQLFIYPEGTRNKSGGKELLEIKSGIITFASKGDCEIIPMVIYRKPKIFRKNYIIVGEPFRIEGENPARLTKEETDANLDRYLEVMKNLRNELEDYIESKKKKTK